MLQSIDKKNKLFFYLSLFFLLSTISHRGLLEDDYSKFKLQNIEVYGLLEEENLDVLKDLKGLLFENIFFIDQDKIQDILSNNSLIDNYKIKKKYPNLIRLDIKRTSFVAITNVKGKKYFVGSNGKLINYNDYKEIKKKIPYIFGKFNKINFVKFKNIIDNSSLNYDDITELYYFPANTWAIKMKKNILIKLPGNKISLALNLTNEILKDNKFKDYNFIDLRIANQIIFSNE